MRLFSVALLPRRNGRNGRNGRIERSFSVVYYRGRRLEG
jgi:hypothetical protein